MVVFNKISIFFVIFFSVIIIIHTYLGETEKAKSNVIYFLMNGFAYIVTAMDMEKRKPEHQL